MMNIARVDVVVVGAGPVGLFLARELVRTGHDVLLVEQNTGQSEHSKALAVMPRTLETFEMAGIVGPFIEAAHRVTRAAVIHEHDRLGQIDVTPANSRYAYIAMIPQDVTETLLLAELRRSGGDVAYETEVIAVERTDASVRLRLRSRGTESTVEAAYVVGADGAHSIVRHAMAIDFAGSSYHQTFILADIETTGDVAADELQLCPHETGALACFPMSATRRRIVAMVDGRGTPAGSAAEWQRGSIDEAHLQEPDLALVQELLDTRGLRALRATRLLWGSRFKIHHRQATAMRAGRVFLAGDAAHIHSPFGAQGMNTGLQDAWNLAWKLRLALTGAAEDALLDSYAVERHAVAERVIRITDVLTRAMASQSALAQAIRNRAIPLLTRFEPFKKLFVETLTELAVGYPHSPIVRGKGRRAEDEPVAGGAHPRLHEQLGTDFVLLTPRDAPAFDGVASRYAGLVHRLTHAHADGVRLVRPDGYIAFESARADLAGAELVEQVLRKQLRLPRGEARR